MRTYRHRDDGRLPAAADGLAVCVRRTGPGVLVCSHLPVAGAAPALEDVLRLASGRRVICELRNDPAEPDFDAPVEASAGLFIDLLRQRGLLDDVLVVSRDWYAVERAAGAGLQTGFMSGEGVAVGGGLAYAVAAGHGTLVAHAGAIGPDSHEATAAAGIELIVWGGEVAAGVDADGAIRD